MTKFGGRCTKRQHGKDPETEELETAGLMTWHNVGVSSYHNEHHVDFVWTTVAAIFVRNYSLFAKYIFNICNTLWPSHEMIPLLIFTWGLFKHYLYVFFLYIFSPFRSNHDEFYQKKKVTMMKKTYFCDNLKEFQQQQKKRQP